MEMEKKNVALIVLVVALVASGLGNIILAIGQGNGVPTYYETLIVGVAEGPVTIDPIDSWDAASNNVILQVAETLFWYDLSDPNLPLEPLLVDDFYWDAGNVELTLILKEDIVFHDNSKFNATSVAWNVDRWLYLTNATKELSSSQIPAFPSSLYYHPNGSPIINSTVINSEYNITIVLNQSFGPFLPLLTYAASSIISNEYHADQQHEILDVNTDKLIGTGPFIYDSYRTDIEVRMSRNPRYWRTGSFFEKLVYDVIEDDTTRNQAMLGGDIDFLQGAEDTLIETFKTNPDTTVKELGVDLLYWYISFNNKLLNVTWRKALSYAYNYTYVIDVIELGNAQRGCPAVPEGMPGHNASVQANLPTMDIPYARELMQSMKFGYDDPGVYSDPWDTTYYADPSDSPSGDEQKWRDATFASDVLGDGDGDGIPGLKLNCHSGSNDNSRLNELAMNNWDLIGVDCYEEIQDFGQFLNYGEVDPDYLQVWYVGWGPDYLDAFNMIYPLFSPDSASDFAQVDIPLVNSLLAQAVAEPVFNVRNEIYERIQYILFGKEFVQMPLWATFQQWVHESELKNVPYNSLANFYFYPCYR